MLASAAKPHARVHTGRLSEGRSAPGGRQLEGRCLFCRIGVTEVNEQFVVAWESVERCGHTIQFGWGTNPFISTPPHTVSAVLLCQMFIVGLRG